MDTLVDFEQKSLEELELAKDKLLGVIKKKLDHNLFQGGHYNKKLEPVGELYF